MTSVLYITVGKRCDYSTTLSLSVSDWPGSVYHSSMTSRVLLVVDSGGLAS